MDHEENVNKLSMKSVKLPIFMGSHTVFQTWWFHFQAFAMVWKFMDSIERTPKMDLPGTATTALSTNKATQRKQMLAKGKMPMHLPI